MAGYETLSVEKRGQVDWLTLNRPDSVNAIDTPLVTELGDYFGRAGRRSRNPHCRFAWCRSGLLCQPGYRGFVGRYERPFGAGMGFRGYLAEVYIGMRRCL